MATTVSISPPPTKDDEFTKSGQSAMALVRSLEKSLNNESSEDRESSTSERDFQQLVSLMDSLIHSTARHGLLRGDEASAERILLSSALQDSGVGKKRGRQRNGNSSTKKHNDSTTGTASPAVTSANLVFTSIIRILGGQQQQDDNNERALSRLGTDDHSLLLLLASDLCTSIAQCVRQQQTKQGVTNKCATAELELMSSHAKPLLNGIANSMELIIADSSVRDEFPMEPMEHVALLALKACHRAATSIIALLGNRLSRASSVVQRIATIGVWKSLAIMDSNTITSASMLNATLPLAGVSGLHDQKQKNGNNHQGKASPSDQWSESLQGTVAMLYMILQAAVPINAGLADRARQHESQLHSIIYKDAADVWIQRMGISDSEDERSMVLLHCLNVLEHMITSLLSAEALGSHSLPAAEVNIVSILDLVEILMSFPVSAETTFLFKTKKRLRHEIYEGGLFSVAGMTKMGNQIKVVGHNILNALLETIRRPALLPFARRLFQSSYTSLLTASSHALRSVLDGENPAGNDPKRRRWLNSSVATRTSALKSVQHVLLTVGAEASPSRSKSFSIGSGRGHQVENLVSLLCGTLVEQLEWFNNEHQSASGEWGTFSEHLECFVASIESLGACLATSGPFLTGTARTLIDSVAKSLLIACPSLELSRVEDPCCVYESIFKLGTQACSTAWPDGAASSLGPDLRACAKELLETKHCDGLAYAASAAQRICDTVDAPRVPALTLVTRKPKLSATMTADASALASRIRNMSSKKGAPTNAAPDSKRPAEEPKAPEPEQNKRQKQSDEARKTSDEDNVNKSRLGEGEPAKEAAKQTVQASSTAVDTTDTPSSKKLNGSNTAGHASGEGLPSKEQMAEAAISRKHREPSNESHVPTHRQALTGLEQSDQSKDNEEAEEEDDDDIPDMFDAPPDADDE